MCSYGKCVMFTVHVFVWSFVRMVCLFVWSVLLPFRIFINNATWYRLVLKCWIGDMSHELARKSISIVLFFSVRSFVGSFLLWRLFGQIIQDIHRVFISWWLTSNLWSTSMKWREKKLISFQIVAFFSYVCECCTLLSPISCCFDSMIECSIR